MWGRVLACVSAAAVGTVSTAALQGSPQQLQVEARVNERVLAFVLDDTFFS